MCGRLLLLLDNLEHLLPARLDEDSAERANRLHTRFALNENNLPVVLRICQELAGLPLGIELAAGEST